MLTQRWANRFLRVVRWVFGSDVHRWPVGTARWVYRLARLCACCDDKLRRDAKDVAALWNTVRRVVQ